MENTPRTVDPQCFAIRPATKDDVTAITEVFYRSFNAKFWQYIAPDTPALRSWWSESWEKGLDDPASRTFVAVAKKEQDKVVGFSRWQVPQEDGNLDHDCFAEVKAEDWDMDVAGPLFGGMDANRQELLGKRPHWFLDLLGVHEEYQRQGIAASLIEWGTEQADRDKVETHLHGTEAGQPYYKKYHHFKPVKGIDIPDRPEYGSFRYVSMIRPARQA